MKKIILKYKKTNLCFHLFQSLVQLFDLVLCRLKSGHQLQPYKILYYMTTDFSHIEILETFLHKSIYELNGIKVIPTFKPNRFQ